jgi:molybdate transport system ATP-binding protein
MVGAARDRPHAWDLEHDPEERTAAFGQDHAPKKDSLMLVVEVEKKLGDFAVNVRFASEGGATALFGPSGSGKTSIVNMIAGLMKPDGGRILLDDVVLFDRGARIDVPVWRRRIGYVFQEGRLFPHISVSRNLDYGRWMGGHPADPVAFAHAVELLDIGHLLERRPGKLSGGERQRVAVGRALLMRPRLLLLDEPLAALDAGRKGEILPYLERLRDEAKVPMIYVSHEATEVARIASRVVRIEGGKVAAEGGVELLG